MTILITITHSPSFFSHTYIQAFFTWIKALHSVVEASLQQNPLKIIHQERESN